MKNIIKKIVYFRTAQDEIENLKRQLDYARASAASLATKLQDTITERDRLDEKLYKLSQGIPVIVVKPELI